MAKCKSHLMSVIRGSVAGLTYTSNTFCSIIMRNRTIPTNTNTQYQQQIRGALTQSKAIWPTLSDAVRRGWDQWGATVHLQGPTGEYIVPGRQWYIGIRAAVYYLALRGLAFGAATNNPPLIAGLISTGIWVTTAPATGIGYKVAFSPITTELLKLYSFRSRKFTPDRNFYSGPWDCTTLTHDTQTLVSDPLEFTRSDLEEDGVYFERCRIISNQGPFRVSEEVILRITAVSGADRSPQATLVSRRAQRSSLPA